MPNDLLDTARRWLCDSVAPIAAVLDVETNALRSCFQDLGRHGWLALKAPTELGGHGLGPRDAALWQAEVARYSGALAFLQTQHQSAVGMIASGSNADLQQRLLPKMATGEVTMGIAYGHLRRPGRPAVSVRETDDAMIFDGQSPWVTGASLFDRVLVGGMTDDGRAVFAPVPLADSESASGGIRLGQPMLLASMSHTQTVALTLRSWSVPIEDVARVEPPGWMAERDARIIARKAFFALGCARAGLDIVQSVGDRRQNKAIRDAADCLEAEFETTREVLVNLVGSDEEGSPLAMEKRAHAVELSVRCAHAAVLATSGSANLGNNPAQRVYREALVFSVLAQTRELQSAVLARLCSP